MFLQVHTDRSLKNITDRIQEQHGQNTRKFNCDVWTFCHDLRVLISF